MFWLTLENCEWIRSDSFFSPDYRTRIDRGMHNIPSVVINLDIDRSIWFLELKNVRRICTLMSDRYICVVLHVSFAHACMHACPFIHFRQLKLIRVTTVINTFLFRCRL